MEDIYKKLGMVLLPPLEHRRVLRSWKVIGLPVETSRSFEVVDGQLFLVARVLDEDRWVGGEAGILLSKVSETSFVAPALPPNKYFIEEDGSLVGHIGDDFLFKASPM